MKTKFTRMERTAGFFVIATFLFGLAAGISILIGRGWFDSKVTFYTELESAVGIRSGTDVLLAGLKVGSVEGFAFRDAKAVVVKFSVLEKYRQQIRRDTKIIVHRPFVIGDKVMELTMGESNELLKEREHVPVIPSYDLLELLNGKKLGPLLASLEGISENLRVFGAAFSDTKRTENLIKTIDNVLPLTQNLNKMSLEATAALRPLNNNRRVEILVQELVPLTQQLSQIMPEVSGRIPQLVESVTNLTEALEKFVPAINTVAPELPQATLRALQALDETVITLKAIQKSFLLRGSVRDVKAEELKEKTQERQPASENSEHEKESEARP